MMLHASLIALSLLMLFLGAESLVRGSAGLAVRAGLSPLVVGLTIVAFGTSSPELVVSIRSALAGQGDLSVGNVVGSNIFNIGVILGITALMCPVPVHRQVLRIDAPVALAVALLLPILLLDTTLVRLEGGLLLGGILAYTWINVALARREPIAAEGDAASPPRRHWAVDGLLILAGLGVLVFGSRLLVDHAVALATAFGISEAIIGLTIVAAGTSMPELATSVVAAFRRQPDIAIGNVIGSNVFNILGILGAASVVAPLGAPGIAGRDYLAVILFTALLLPLLHTGARLQRLEGLLLLGLYGAYLIMLWPN